MAKTIPMEALADVADRFWSKVQCGGPDECWPWVGGSRDKDGYGLFHIRIDGRQKMYRSHRLAYAIDNDEDPAALQVLHTCDNPPCCNPAHLWTGTNKDNIADRDSKGRGCHGEDHPFTPLKTADVVMIRELRASGTGPAELARRYGMSIQAISSLTSGQTWKSAGGPRTPLVQQKIITAAQGVEIRERFADGETEQALGDEFGLTPDYVLQIVRGQSWRSTGGPLTRPHRFKLKGKLREVLQRYDAGSVTMAELGEEYGVTKGSISKAIQRARGTT